mgnify:CR=1 FL=1
MLASSAVTIAPEFFTRAGDPNSYGTIAEIQSNIVAKTPDAQVLNDLQGALVWAGKKGYDIAKAVVEPLYEAGRKEILGN